MDQKDNIMAASNPADFFQRASPGATMKPSASQSNHFSASKLNMSLRIVLAGLLGASLAALPSCRGGSDSVIHEAAVPPLPGMPPVVEADDIYSEARAAKLSPVARNFPERVYVPNSGSNTVEVIDPKSFRVIRKFAVGKQPQHVTPSYDLKTLWVLNDLGDSLTRIDPATGEKRETIRVKDPYNMYYTPDGKYAIVVAEREKRLDFYDAQTMILADGVKVPCRGVDHMDFSANGRFLIASCEFSGELVKVDVATRKVLGTLQLSAGGTPVATHRGVRMHHGGGRMPVEADRMPQDVKTSPDGKLFFVADMMADGVHVIDPEKLVSVGFIPTGLGAHGLYASRDSKVLYCSNRDEGTVSVIDFASRKVVKKWQIPNGGSPDMGGVSADGKVLWLTGRYHREVYAIDTVDGHLLARIRVGKGPHGLCVYPQPGRYSLGHTGVFR
jgi:YVTN family beta-propeller protein